MKKYSEVSIQDLPKSLLTPKNFIHVHCLGISITVFDVLKAMKDAMLVSEKDR